MIRIVGFIFIIFSCSGLGYVLSSRLSMRVRELKLLRISLQMLETEIVYSNTPLPLAFNSVQKKCGRPVKNLFKTTSENLDKKVFGTVGEAFSASIEENKDILSLNREDMEILKSFGYSIGSSDVEGQVKSFNMVLKQLDGQEIKAEDIRSKNEKMYRNLGFLAGLAIVIILL